MNEKIKVVWLCHFSNPKVHDKLELGYGWLLKTIRKVAHKPISTEVLEFANWITNGIKEFEKFDDVELHIVSPYPQLRTKQQEFTDKGINYHFFQNEDDVFFTFIYKKLFRPKYDRYRKNCKTITKIINSIKPDIVHLFGAENPYYALGFLCVPKSTITIAQLQTLMNDPDFKNNYPFEDWEYQYKASVENSIIQRANYIGTVASKYRHIVKKKIKPDAVILNTSLPLKETIFIERHKKEFDFVYFSANLNKAADLAIEAFGIAYQKNPNITLDVIGWCDDNFKQVLNAIIDKYGIRKSVKFEGRLPSHEDVINQIRLSRFALLPLKIDLISGTIREAMANGLPVITTDTGEMGTQILNLKRHNVLITPVGNHQALADNILRVLNDVDLANTLRENAFQTGSEAQSNEKITRMYLESYKACIDNFRKGKPLPDYLVDNNKYTH